MQLARISVIFLSQRSRAEIPRARANVAPEIHGSLDTRRLSDEAFGIDERFHSAVADSVREHLDYRPVIKWIPEA